MSEFFKKPSGRPADAALLDSMRDDASSRSSQVETIEIHKDYLVPRKDQPRKHFPKEVLDQRRQQMEENGQESPITVFPGYQGEDGQTYYEILDGESRWRSILPSEKLDYLRAEITKADRNDKAGILISQLTHNDDGSQPLTPLERAYAYRDIVADMEGKGIDSPKSAAAQRLGMSLSNFSEVLSLAQLPDELGTFALDKGITDAKVLNGMVQVHRKGTAEDVADLQTKISNAIEEGEGLRNVMKDIVAKVKKRKPKKAGAAASTAAKKTEKTKRTLTARDMYVRFKDGEEGQLVIETPREILRLHITREQFEALERKDDAQ